MLRFVLVLVVFGLAGQEAPLATVTTYDHNTDGTASGRGADTSISEHTPSVNRGAEERIEVRFDNTSQNRNSVGILRFDLSAANRRAFDHATLQLYDLRAGTSGDADGHSFQVWALTDQAQEKWDENAITWDTGAPAHSPAAPTFDGPDLTSGAKLLGTITYRKSRSAWSKELPLPDLKSLLAADTDGLITLYLVRDAALDTSFVFASKENTRPSLDAATPALPVGSTAPILRLYPAAPPPVLPKGHFGWKTRGGFGGQVIKVTNLDPSGPGSFREAIETPGPRIVVFEVGGVIDLGGLLTDGSPSDSILKVTEPFCTIAGQTAPSPGITLIRGGFSIQTHDVILQHIAVRPGDAGHGKNSGWEVDSINAAFAQAYDVLIDHCSTTWATDENLSVGGRRNLKPGETAHDVTLSHCLIAEGLLNASHTYPHSMGSLIHDHVQDVAIVANLYAMNNQRNPYFKSQTTGLIANNLIHRPGEHAIQVNYSPAELTGTPVPGKVSIIGNVARFGPGTSAGPFVWGNDGVIYLEDNLVTKTGGDAVALFDKRLTRVTVPPVMPAGFVAMPSGEVQDYVLANCGSRPADRSPIDQRIVDLVKDDGGKIIDSQNEVGGYPALAKTTRALTVPEGGAEAVDAWLKRHAAAVEMPAPRRWFAH